MATRGLRLPPPKMSPPSALRPHHRFPLSPHRLFLKPSFLSTISSTLDPDPYGPTLRRGHGRRLPPPPSPASPTSIDRLSFARSFDLAALRVPAEDCATLESRLRGHLLNWPRVRNIARVPGDDMDPDLKRLIGSPTGDGGERLSSLAGRANADMADVLLPPVLYREKLVREFNVRGFVKFRNLAKISRPKRRKGDGGERERGRERGREREGAELKERMGRNEFVVVELVDDGEEEEDLSGLLGDGFRAVRWRGPTRLLLLDERYAKKGAEELPEAIKAVLQGDLMKSSTKCSELVDCKLTLFYNYWSMNEILEAFLPEGTIIPTGFETVGHIAHLNLREEHLPYKKLIAQVILDKNNPKIQTVVNKTDAIQNDFRTMQLEVLAGNHSLVTMVIENGFRFQVDLASVYWNSRLATERQRLINRFASSDVVCDVFSGVGPIAISAAKKVKFVYANDLNPIAVEYLERNVVLNKLDRKIQVFNMEGRRFIDTIFTGQQRYNITQVVMNLPKDAAMFLDVFRGIFGKMPKENGCTLPIIHVYGFSKATNPEFDFHERINMALCHTVEEVEMHRVRLVAPGKWMLCASFTLPQAVAFGKERGV